YELLLDTAVIPSIEAKRTPGYRSSVLVRRTGGDEVEFSIMTFDSLDNVIAFQGQDYETAYVPEATRKILKRWDTRSIHRDQRQTPNYRPRITTPALVRTLS